MPKQRASKTIKKDPAPSSKLINKKKALKSGKHSKRRQRDDEKVLELNVARTSFQESVPVITTADYVNNSFAVKEIKG